MRPTPRVLLVLGILGLVAADDPRVRAGSSRQVAAMRETPADAPTAVPGQLIVQFSGDVGLEEAARLVREAGGGRMRPGRFSRRYLISVDDGFSVAEALSRLRGRAEVEYAEPNGIVRASFRPNDLDFELQWHLKMLNVERTWDIQKGDPSVAVAVLDTGIAYEDFGPYRKAPDFGGTVFLPGFDFVNGDEHANDDNFHGTHVASTIAEATNNGEGVAGMAFQTALMPVKVLDDEGSGSFFDVAEGIDFAARDSRVKVINLSLGGEGFSNAVSQAVDRAVAAGITVVAASGNENAGTVSFPASLDKVIAVGAIDGRRTRARYSNFGTALDVMAPGGDVRRDDTGPNLSPDGEPDGVLQQALDPDLAERGIYTRFVYLWVSGTSQATPHVAAMAALLYRQGITEPAAVKAAIESTAADLGTAGRDDTYGHGLIQPAVALKGMGLNR